MGKIMSRSEQLSLIREILPSLSESPKLERMATIAAYAALVGVISERNLITILNYAHLWGEKDREMVYHLLRFYLYSGTVKINNQKLGLVDEVNDNWDPFTDADQQIGFIVRENIDRMRRRYSTNE